MTSNEKYIEGCRAFVPAPDDNPDCVPFYRAWAGVRAVFGKEVMDMYHHFFHEAICWQAGHLPLEQQWDCITKHLQYIIDRWTRPEEPRYSYMWDAKPQPPKEEDARQLFNREFKKAFPGKRANSKEANRLWEEKKALAMKYVTNDYERNLAAYQERVREKAEDNARRRAKWIDEFWGVALFENFVRGIQ